MASGELLLGADVGGTKIAAGVADRCGRVIASRCIPTAPEGGARVVEQIVELLEDLMRESGPARQRVAALGVSVPAVIDQERGVVLWAPNIAGWQGEVEVAGPISRALGVPTSLHYDGHAWMMGEWWCGAARGARDAALIAVGTGIGGGLILGGRLHTGCLGVAGAIGWWVMDWQGVGSAGPVGGHNLEALASGPAIAAAAGKHTAQEVFEAARTNDPRARKAVEQAASALGAAVANLVSLVDPEMVVLAGGVIQGGTDLLLPRIQELVRDRAQPQISRRVRVLAAELGEEAAWLGAALLAYQRTNQQEGVE